MTTRSTVIHLTGLPPLAVSPCPSRSSLLLFPIFFLLFPTTIIMIIQCVCVCFSSLYIWGKERRPRRGEGKHALLMH